MALEIKNYLDYEGLETYDENIKKYFTKKIESGVNSALEKEISDRKAAIEAVNADIEELKNLVGEESVKQVVDEAIKNVIAGAPEAFDTLKEIADWIEEHGEGATALLNTVKELSEKVDLVDAKVDAAYAAIQPIALSDIKALFLEAVELADGQTVAAAIAALTEDQKLVLTTDVDEALTIDKDAVIEAKGVVFNETVTVAKDAQVSIIGATFAKPVVVA